MPGVLQRTRTWLAAKSKRQLMFAGPLWECANEVTRLQNDLQEIINILGTGACLANTCPGCRYEMEAVADLARRALAKDKT